MLHVYSICVRYEWYTHPDLTNISMLIYMKFKNPNNIIRNFRSENVEQIDHPFGGEPRPRKTEFDYKELLMMIKRTSL